MRKVRKMNRYEKWWYQVNINRQFDNKGVTVFEKNNIFAKAFMWPAYALAYGLTTKEKYSNKKESASEKPKKKFFTKRS